MKSKSMNEKKKVFPDVRSLRSIFLFLCFFLFSFALTGCSFSSSDELSVTGFAFDTVYTITLYEGGSQELLDSCVGKCAEYEQIFSRTSSGSELYQVNEIEKCYEKAVQENREIKSQWDTGSVHYTDEDIILLQAAVEGKKGEENGVSYQIEANGAVSFAISDSLLEMVEIGLTYSNATEKKFDLAIEPVSALWDFTSDSAKVPDDGQIQEELGHVDSEKVKVEGGRLIFDEPGMGLDLGGIAKGFIADRLKEYLTENGVSAAVINLGGDVLCIGEKSDGSFYTIGVQQPFGQENETVAALNVKDMSVVSSGIYERYFEGEDGTIYHHILDPQTGYPCDTDLLSATIITDTATQGDMIATACFVLGSDEALSYINSLDGVYAMFITRDKEIFYSEGFSYYLAE